jgi:hypothetical protein
MIKGEHIQQAFDGFGLDNFGMWEVGGVGVRVCASVRSQPTNGTFGFCLSVPTHGRQKRSSSFFVYLSI